MPSTARPEAKASLWSLLASEPTDRTSVPSTSNVTILLLVDVAGVAGVAARQLREPDRAIWANDPGARPRVEFIDCTCVRCVVVNPECRNPEGSLEVTSNKNKELKMDPSRIAESISAGVENAMGSISLGMRAAGGEACAASARAQEILDVGRDHLGTTLATIDSAIIQTLKQGILYGIDHQVISAASVTTVAVLGVPALRRMAWRATFGRFTSQENLLQTSESSVSSMLGDLQIQKNEIEKLGERLTMAQEEYARGKAKLVAAAREMRALESRAGKSERRAKDLLYEIRGIRAKGALQLRSDAAVVVEAAKAQRRQVEKICWKLDSHML